MDPARADCNHLNLQDGSQACRLTRCTHLLHLRAACGSATWGLNKQQVRILCSESLRASCIALLEKGPLTQRLTDVCRHGVSLAPPCGICTVPGVCGRRDGQQRVCACKGHEDNDCG